MACIHRDGRRSNLEEFDLKKLVRLRHRAVSSVVVTGDLERTLWSGHDFDLG